MQIMKLSGFVKRKFLTICSEYFNIHEMIKKPLMVCLKIAGNPIVYERLLSG